MPKSQLRIRDTSWQNGSPPDCAGKKSASKAVTDYFKVCRRVYQIQETLMEMKLKFQQNTRIKLINIKPNVCFLHVISINESLNLRTGLH
jgi:hypothetical protein